MWWNPTASGYKWMSWMVCASPGYPSTSSPMTEFVEVAVNVPGVSDVFHYHLPDELAGKIRPGHLVQVPFGRQEVQAVIVRSIEQPSISETKAITALLDELPVTTTLHLRLAQELASATLNPLAACLSLLIPSGLDKQADAIYTPGLGRGGAPSLTPSQERLLKLLEQRGPLRGSQIDHALPRLDWRKAARALVNKGLLRRQTYLPPPSVRAKTVRVARLAVDPETARQSFERLGRAGTPAQARRRAILELLTRETGALALAWGFAETGGNLEDLRKLVALGLVTLEEAQTWRSSLKPAGPEHAPIVSLTPAQLSCWEQIELGLQETFNGHPVIPYLLHGVTGSGKTELYLRAVAAVLKAGRQALVLVPEIALTPQTTNRFLSRFPGQVGLLHSQLSEGERYDTWRRAQMGQISVVVGPRSALFTPFPNLGLLVLDELHDDSYYQDDPPSYDTRSAALLLTRLAGALCLLGSATPDIASAYAAAQGQWRYLRLAERVRAHTQTVAASDLLEANSATLELPPVQVVDMRLELQSGNRSMFSRALQQGLEQALAGQQQAILYLNRRGTATHVFCRDCGHVLKCPRCDIPMTFHSSPEALLCHRCGYQRRMPGACPACKSARIRQYGAGTERVEAELRSLFPDVRALRWDHETTRKKGAHEHILNQFTAHQADVLVGTQMLAKGLDLPLVTLVGVVLADAGLNLPDYRAAERTFQLLTQVAGRAGRSPLGGKVILQTFQPEHYAIQSAAQHDFRAFYLKELEYRRQLHYPPFARLVRLEYRHADAQKAEVTARKLALQLDKWLQETGQSNTERVGPAPCFFTRISGLFRWQILLRGPDPLRVLQGRSLPDWRLQVDPPTLL
jgi:primosomal protein N' (replication factor Y)